MPRSSRLRLGYQHARVRSEGISFHGALMRMSLFVSGQTSTQAAVVVSRRVGPAIIRNRVKRRLKEIYRHELPSLKPGLWLVVTAKPASAKASLSTLRVEWLRLAARHSIFADLR